MRKIFEAAVLIFVFAAFGPALAAQNNPLPFLNNPTVPGAVAPGGPAFTLTVNGAGFVNGATILWNGSARITTFVSASRLTAAILASDIATANLVFVAVSNPTPGGGISNSVLFSIATPTTSLAYTSSIIGGGFNDFTTARAPTDLVTAFDSPYQISFLAYSNGGCPFIAGCIRDQGAIESIGSDGRALDVAPLTIAAGDFNGDGSIDLVTLGNGGGASNPPLASGLYATVDLSAPSPFSLFGSGTPITALPSGTSISPQPVVGDFNRDGRLDIVTGGQSGIYFVPGNGDGTFGTAIPSSTESSVEGGLVAGDFNGDGILDLAVTNPLLNTVSILIGNGDGTFEAAVDYATGTNPTTVATSDFTGDGKLDLAVLDGSGATVSILTGNGDGTFKSHVEYPAALSGISLALGDYNGDGIPDIAVLDTQCTSGSCATSGSVNILVGNGDGTFQTQLDFSAGSSPIQFATTALPAYARPLTGRAQIAVISLTQNTLTLLTPLVSQSGNPVPAINSISPASEISASGSFTLTVNGSNFVSGSTVNFGGVNETTSFVSTSQLTAAIPSSAITTVGSVLVSVTSPTPGGGTSNTLSFSVLLPPPTISSIVPASVIAGSPGFTLAVNGTNFVNGSTVNINGVSRTTAFISATQITTSMLSWDLLNVATINVSVTNPVGVDSSTGGTSPTLPLMVVPPNSQPTVGTLSPPSTTAGNGAFTLTISGNGFSPASVVTFGSTAVSSVYLSPAELQASIPASAIALAGTPLLTVTNPGSSPSVAVTFTVNNPAPTEFGITPPSAAVGSAGFTLNVSGIEFTPSSTVLVNGKSRATTFVDQGHVQGSLLTSDLAQAGTLNISVSNPAPGGGISNAVPFAVNNLAPIENSLSPSSVLVGSAAFTLDVNGSNFNSTSTIQVNGESRTTTFVSTLLLQINILAADLAMGGTLNISVNNPTPGGGTTPILQFGVTDYTVKVPPSLSTMTVTAGQPATYGLTVASANGTYSNPVKFSVTSGLPPEATASFSSTTITPSDVSQIVTLSIATTPHTLSAVPRFPKFPGTNRPVWFLLIFAAMSFVLSVLALSKSGRRAQQLAPQFLLALLLLLAAGLAACNTAGGGSTTTGQPILTTGTPAGIYTIVVTATSGANTHTTSVTLTVN